MNWKQQAVHVARKDARMSVGLLVLFCGVIVLATASTLGYVGLPNGFWGLLTIFVMTLCIANTVHADSPYRDDAFWMTKPFAPVGMMSGKLLFIIGLLAVAGTAQAIAFAAHDLTPSKVAWFTAESLLGTAGTLATVFLFAAITSNLSTLLLALIAMIVFNLALTFGIARLFGEEPFTPDMSAAPPAAVFITGALVLAVTVLLTVHLYRTRRRFVVLAIFLLTTVAAMLAGRLTEIDERSPEVKPGLAPISGIEIQAALPSRGEAPPSTVMAHIGIRLSGVKSERGYVLHNPRARVRLPDGRTVTGISNMPEIILREPKPNEIILSHSGSPVAPPADVEHVVIAAFMFDRETVAAIDKGAAQVTLSGELREFISVVDTTVALEEGRTYVFDGRRMRIAKVDWATPALDVFMSETGADLPIMPGQRSKFPNSVDYALTNATQTRFQALQHQGSMSSTMNLVLFSRHARLNKASFRPKHPGSVAFGPGGQPPAPPERDWTRLVLFKTEAVAASRVEIKVLPQALSNI